MEKQLETLGIRWTTVCQWVEQRSSHLNVALNQWRMFDDRLSSFVTWLTETEDTLADIEQRRQSFDDLQMADISEIVEQLQCLKVSESSSSNIKIS